MVEYKEHLNIGLTPDVGVTRSVDKVGDFPRNNEFTLTTTDRKYDRQFYSMYQYRFKDLKERVMQNAVSKWGNGDKKVDGRTLVKQDKILDIKRGEVCWVIGTVFCDLKNKLNIFQDVEKGIDDVLPMVPDNYRSETESESSTSVMLEDESGRAILHNDEYLKNNLLVTGCIVGVLGIEIQAGIFEIMDIAYPSISPQLTMNPTPGNKLILVSGLNIGDDTTSDLRLEMLAQYVRGELGLDVDKENMSQVSRMIIAGDSIEPLAEVRDLSAGDFVTTNNYGSKNISTFNPESAIKLDLFLREILVTLPVLVMPGANDPAEICLPQQPLHKSMFRSSLPLLNGNHLVRATNPQWFEQDSVRILGSSGQNVDDVYRYMSRESSTPENAGKSTLAVMENNIRWQNIVPTAPDTLYCYPYENFDPFLLDETPHVYFVGNQESFQTDMVTNENINVRTISIPKFSTTGEFVVLDLVTLEANVVKIG